MKEMNVTAINNESDVMQAILKTDVSYVNHENVEVVVPKDSVIYVDYRDGGEIFALMDGIAFQIFSDEFAILQ